MCFSPWASSFFSKAQVCVALCNSRVGEHERETERQRDRETETEEADERPIIARHGRLDRHREIVRTTDTESNHTHGKVLLGCWEM